MREMILFSGTTEGRELADWLAGQNVKCTVCVATEYGELVMEENPQIQVLRGRMNREQMADLMQRIKPHCVVDATHPFATEVTREIQAACKETGMPYYRLGRETSKFFMGKTDSESHGLETSGGQNTETEAAEAFAGQNTETQEQNPEQNREQQCRGEILYVDTMEQAAKVLEQMPGNILLTTGSKELAIFTKHFTDLERVYVRVLPSEESIRLCNQAGIFGKHIVAMQGPFSTEMNVALLKSMKTGVMLTKESGIAGGYPEKIEAAGQCGVKVLVISNPEKKNAQERYDAAQIRGALKNLVEEKREARLTVAGIGMGNAETMTLEAKRAIEQAQVLFGAPRILESLGKTDKKQEAIYKSEEIIRYLSEHPELDRAVLVVSGDSGFYSGAAAFSQSELPKPWKLKILPGISSVSYFAAKLGISWQDWRLFSAHGRECDIETQIQAYEKCFFLVNSVEAVRDIGRKLRKRYGDTLEVSFGYKLSYPDEQVLTGTTKLLCNLPEELEGLCVLLVCNKAAEKR